MIQNVETRNSDGFKHRFKLAQAVNWLLNLFKGLGDSTNNQALVSDGNGSLAFKEVITVDGGQTIAGKLTIDVTSGNLLELKNTGALKAYFGLDGRLWIQPNSNVQLLLDYAAGFRVMPKAAIGGWSMGMTWDKQSDGSRMWAAGVLGTDESIVSYNIGQGTLWYSTGSRLQINCSTGKTSVWDGAALKEVIHAGGGQTIAGSLTATTFVGDGSALTGIGAFRGALVYKTGSPVTIANNAIMTWDSESYDTDSIFTVGTSASRLVVPTGVTKVRLNCSIGFSGLSDAKYFKARITKNGGVYPGVTTGGEQNNSGADMSFDIAAATPVLTVTSGDYFEVVIFHLDSPDPTLQVNLTQTWFAMEIIE